MKIAIAGATGFIGRNLIDVLLKTTDHSVVLLSRNPGESHSPRLEVRACDLYSILEAENGLDGCDTAIYLVHSMAPRTSRLAQGNFRDFDFLLADNFARAAQNKGVKHIIYVSGIVPLDAHLSRHLSSRYEVEQTLAYRKIPLTTLRCGLVIGTQGSSYQILDRLIDRLPIMILPSWMNTRTQVVYVKDLARIIIEFINDGPSSFGSYDIGGPEIITYKELMLAIEKLKNKKIWNIPVPNIPLRLSRYWVQLIAGVPKTLVYPLIESLRHEMLCNAEHRLPRWIQTPFTPLNEALKSIQTDESPKLPVQFHREKVEVLTEVQSVQRLCLPDEWTSRDVATAYLRWLPHFMRTWIYAKQEMNNVFFYFYFWRKPLLVLSLSVERSFLERQMFFITAGALVNVTTRGRLEFVEGVDKTFVIAAIHRFRPKLPWYIYRFTQAIVHVWVMRQFQKYLLYKHTRQAPPPVLPTHR